MSVFLGEEYVEMYLDQFFTLCLPLVQPCSRKDAAPTCGGCPAQSRLCCASRSIGETSNVGLNNLDIYEAVFRIRIRPNKNQLKIIKKITYYKNFIIFLQ